MPRKPDCHPEKTHVGHGLCEACYQRWKRTKFPVASPCHPERPLYAKGMCNPCYQRSTADREQRRLSERARRQRPGFAHRRAGWIRQGCVNPPDSVPDVPCEICGKRGDLHLDHDHATGLFRGWLCNGCNCGLGNLRDDAMLLQRAIEYLQRAR